MLEPTVVSPPLLRLTSFSLLKFFYLGYVFFPKYDKPEIKRSYAYGHLHYASIQVELTRYLIHLAGC